MDGRVLRFVLGGNNNQNFLMRDLETGTWWQQVTGKAIFGPLAGRSLDLYGGEELSFAEWKNEFPQGGVLAPVPGFEARYAKNWEKRTMALPVPGESRGGELQPRDIVLGVSLAGQERAYPASVLAEQSPVEDQVGNEPIMVTLGPDSVSARAFLRQVGGKESDFYRNTQSGQWVLIDSATGSTWDFRGCAVSGPAQGNCLTQIAVLREFWFDWRRNHPGGSLYRLGTQLRSLPPAPEPQASSLH